MPTGLVDGRPIAWREAGSGVPALMLHCALAHSGAWSGVASRLPGLATRALDLPGHGGTGREARLTPQAQAVADATALLAASGPAHLIGHSFGATVALRLAVEAPALVRSLVLVEPVMFAFLADAGDRAAYEAEMADQAAYRVAARAGDWRAVADGFLRRCGVPGGLAGLPPQQAAYVLDRIGFIAESEVDLHDEPGRHLRLADLDGLDRPVLLVAGAESPPVIPAILDAIAARLPRARRAVIPGAAHMLPVTHPAALAEAIAPAVARAA